MTSIPSHPLSIMRVDDEPSLIGEGVELIAGLSMVDRYRFRVRYRLRVPKDVRSPQLVFPALDWPDAIFDVFASGSTSGKVDGDVLRFDFSSLLADEVIHLEVGFELGRDVPPGICTSLPWDLPTPWIEAPEPVGPTSQPGQVLWGDPGVGGESVGFRSVFGLPGAGPQGSTIAEVCIVRLTDEFADFTLANGMACSMSKGVKNNGAFIRDVLGAASGILGGWWQTPPLASVSVILDHERGAHRMPEAPGIIVLPKGVEGTTSQQLPDLAFSIARQLCRTWFGGLVRVVQSPDSVDYESFLGGLALVVVDSLKLGWPEVTLGPRLRSTSRIVEAMRRPRRVLSVVGRAQYEAMRLSELIHQVDPANLAFAFARHTGEQVEIVEAPR